MGKKKRKKRQQAQQAVETPSAKAEEAISLKTGTISRKNVLRIIGACVLVFIVAFMVYANTLQGDFIWDDEYLILNNTQIKSFSHLPNVFKTYVGYGSENINNFYRPVQEISNMIDWFLWGKVPFGFHLTNTILHALVAVLVFLFLFYLAGDIFIAGIASLLWAVHPVHTEGVAYIAGRADSLYSLFMLLSLVLFVIFVNGTKEKKKILGAYLFSLICFILSLLSKEIVLTMPVLIFLYLFYFLRKTEHNNVYKKLRWSWAPYAVIVVVYGFLRKSVLDFSDIAPQSVFVKIPLGYRLVTFFRTVVIYFKLLIWPTDLHMERTLEISNSIFEPSAIFAMLIIGLLVWGLIKTYKKNRLISFGIAWFFVNLFPVSNIIPINSFLAEHWIYMASMGIFLMVAVGAAYIYREKLPRGPVFRISYIGLLAIIIALYGRAAMIRNLDWKDEISFFNSTLKYHPRNARLYLNLGNTYYEKGQLDEAIAQYRKSIEINPKYAVAYGNIASANLHRGNLKEAERNLLLAIKMKHNYPIAHYNLGIVYFQKGNYDDSIRELKIATKQLPQLYQAWNMMGRAYLKIGNIKGARDAFERSLKIFPSQGDIQRVLGRINEDIASGKLKI